MTPTAFAPRTFLRHALAAASLLLAGASHAAGWPEKPITLGRSIFSG